jgi:mono/diheme cytochrome c family protein
VEGAERRRCGSPTPGRPNARTCDGAPDGIGVGATLLLAACTGSDGDGAPASAPFTGSDGATLYAQACASCHGLDLRGTNEGPPFLDAIYRPGHHADVSFHLAVRSGARAHHWSFGNMPPIEGLTDEQIAAIVEFVREQQRAAGIE